VRGPIRGRSILRCSIADQLRSVHCGLVTRRSASRSHPQPHVSTAKGPVLYGL
jgi:hypothetical protein